MSEREKDMESRPTPKQKTPQMGKRDMSAQLRNTDAIDLLDDAKSMIQFMVEVSPAFAINASTDGISEDAAFGFSLIFGHIKQTIDHARELI